MHQTPAAVIEMVAVPPSGRRTPARVARIRVRGREHQLPHRAGAALEGVGMAQLTTPMLDIDSIEIEEGPEADTN
jgi:hypothetical protein